MAKIKILCTSTGCIEYAPERYHNLVVRIAGYSAYFVDMTEQMQNDIISRAEHTF